MQKFWFIIYYHIFLITLIFNNVYSMEKNSNVDIALQELENRINKGEAKSFRNFKVKRTRKTSWKNTTRKNSAESAEKEIELELTLEQIAKMAVVMDNANKKQKVIKSNQQAANNIAATEEQDIEDEQNPGAEEIWNEEVEPIPADANEDIVGDQSYCTSCCTCCGNCKDFRTFFFQFLTSCFS